MAAKQTKRTAPATRKRKQSLRFPVVVEFLAGTLIGVFGLGRLFAGRAKEARWFLIASLVLIIPIGFAPQLLGGDEYAAWAPWVVKFVLALLSALELNFVLSRA